MMKFPLISLFFFFLANLNVVYSFGQSSDSIAKAPEEQPYEQLESFLSKFNLKAYGVVNYYAFDWETLPEKR